MKRSDFDYELPAALIAQQPTEDRSQSRLLVLDGDQIRHQKFADVVHLLRADDLLVVNDTAVIKARLHAQKDSGGAAEVMVERICSTADGAFDALCQVRASKALKAGRHLCIADRFINVVGREGEFYRLRFPEPVVDFLDRFGQVPLPPYIQREAVSEDLERYQTVFSRTPGAVAAPTAGLHFDKGLLAEIRSRGVTVAPVTLHVGAGTFQPVRADELDDHHMHFERFEVPANTRQAIDECRGRIVAVGTTVVRTLESAAALGRDSGETDLFIKPGYRFQVVDALITNFHLPESTLLMLVSAFAGIERIRAAYAAAIADEYRFFSYGDAMFCERAANAAAVSAHV